MLDNASDDGSADAVRALGRDIRLIALDRRAGKAANDSRLLQEARGEFCLLLNEDSELRPGAVAALLGALQSDRNAAAAGAQLLDARWPRGSLRLAAAQRGDGVGGRLLPASPVHGRERRHRHPPGRLGAIERDAGAARGGAEQVDWLDPRLLRLLRRDRLLQAPPGRGAGGSSTCHRPGRSTTTRWPRTPPGPSGERRVPPQPDRYLRKHLGRARGVPDAAGARLALPAARRRGARSSRIIHRRGATGSTLARRSFRAVARGFARRPRPTTGPGLEARVVAVRILEVTQMWPSPEQPDLGSFLVPLTREIEALGHEVEVASISQRGGSRVEVPAPGARVPRRGTAVPARCRLRPFPLSRPGPPGRSRPAPPARPLGRHGAWPGRRQPRPDPRRHGRDALGAGPLLRGDRQLALARRSTHRADPGGRDEDRRSPTAGSTWRRSRPARPTKPDGELGWDGEGPAFLCVGSLIERKNVVAPGRCLRLPGARPPRLRRGRAAAGDSSRDEPA